MYVLFSKLFIETKIYVVVCLMLKSIVLQWLKVKMKMFYMAKCYDKS